MITLSLRYGLILGVSSLVWQLILYIMGMHDSQDWKLQIINTIICIVVIVLGLLEFRKIQFSLSIQQSIKIGVIISIIGTIIGIIYYFILTNIIDPGMVERQIDEVVDNYIAKNPETSDAGIDQLRTWQEFGRKPLFFIGVALIFSVMYGFVFGLVSGLLLRRKSEIPS